MAQSIVDGKSTVADPNMEATVKVLVRIMETTSICGLGQVAGNPLRSYLRYASLLQAKKTS
jgi:NADH:ubiquinone oxidoreductase subunit F (NADH-binding)